MVHGCIRFSVEDLLLHIAHYIEVGGANLSGKVNNLSGWLARAAGLYQR